MASISRQDALAKLKPLLPRLRSAHLLSPEDRKAVMETLEWLAVDDRGWPLVYFNRDTGKVYTPHHERERDALCSDTPRYTIYRGGEGSGKSVVGIIKVLDRLKRGMSGLMISPTLTHFQVSLWPEFRRWCPWNCVVAAHQKMSHLDWIPYRPFDIVFKNDTVLHCAGIKDPGSLEGPNINFVHFDEARHYPDATAIKTLDGRIRIPGPKGELPQIWITTTPRRNWLFDFFGPILPNDPYESFKRNSKDVVMLTEDNEPNLEKDFHKKRAQSLTSREIAVLLRGEWEDIEEGQPFLPNMVWWDQCREDLPPLAWHDPMVVALDAATGRQFTSSDCFAIVGVTRHPDPERADTDIAVRFVQTWQAGPGQKIDFVGDELSPGPEMVLRDLIERFNVVCVTYDKTELHSLAQKFLGEGEAWLQEFGQSSRRNEADRQLLNLIQQKRIAHDGNEELRRHIQNADRKMDSTNKRLRIVKRHDNLKVDLAVALSMSALVVLELNL